MAIGMVERLKKGVKANDAKYGGRAAARGAGRAKGILGEEGLRTAEMKDVMAKRKQQMEEGISPEAMEAKKSQLAQQMMKAQQKAGLRMGSALGGQTGAGAAAQQRSLAQSGQQAQAGIARDLFLAQEAAKERGLGAYEKSVEFDVGQMAKEKEFIAQQAMFEKQIDQQKKAVEAEQAALRAQKQKSKKGAGLGSVLGGIAGNIIAPGAGGAIGSSLGGALGGLFD